MSDEIWKDVEGYEGLYQASSYGRVRALVKRNNAYPKDGILKGGLNSKGYFHYILTDASGGRKIFKAHRLIASVFLGECPEGMQVNHIDANKLNNRIENLEYITQRENIHHSMRLGLHPKGIKQGHSKLTEAQVLEIRARYIPNVVSQSMLAKEYGVTKTLIRQIIKRRNWKHI